MTPLQRLAIISAAMMPFLAARARPPAAAGAAASVVPRVSLVIPDAVRIRLLQSGWVNPPPEHRIQNWTGRRGEGSCMWASLMNLLHWQGRPDLADWIRRNCGDGACATELTNVLDRAGCNWASGNDVSFLEWACRTRRGAIVDWGGSHVVNLVGLDDESAWILDNTGPRGRQIIRYQRAAFLEFWRQSGAWALTPLVGEPAPPQPWLFQAEDES